MNKNKLIAISVTALAFIILCVILVNKGCKSEPHKRTSIQDTLNVQYKRLEDANKILKDSIVFHSKRADSLAAVVPVVKTKYITKLVELYRAAPDSLKPLIDSVRIAKEKGDSVFIALIKEKNIIITDQAKTIDNKDLQLYNVKISEGLKSDSIHDLKENVKDLRHSIVKGKVLNVVYGVSFGILGRASSKIIP